MMEQDVRLTGVEAGGAGTQLGQHAARFQGGEIGVFQGSHTFGLQDEHGQVAQARSGSACLA